MRIKSFPIATSSILLSYFVNTGLASTPELVRRATPLGYSYVGCIRTEFTLDYYAGYSQTGMTLEKCALACGDYAYFLTIQAYCYCDNSINDKSPTIVSDPLCDVPCPGNDRSGTDSFCGGSYYQGYQLVDPTANYVPTELQFTSVGCYTEPVGDSLLVGRDTVIDPYISTLQYCEAICQGYNYYGMTQGSQCVCGDTLEADNRVAAPESCDARCVDDGTQSCGSTDVKTFNLYAKPTYTACTDLDSPRRVQNPGFENGIIKWHLSSGMSPNLPWQSIAFSRAPSGKRVARIVSRTSEDFTFKSETVATCPGIGYIVTFWAAQLNSNICYVQVILGNAALSLNLPQFNGQYYQVYLTPQEVSMEVTFRINCGVSGFQILYIDDVQLRPATIADAAFFPVISD